MPPGSRKSYLKKCGSDAHWSSKSNTQLAILSAEPLGREKYTLGVERKTAEVAEAWISCEVEVGVIGFGGFRGKFALQVAVNQLSGPSSTYCSDETAGKEMYL